MITIDADSIARGLMGFYIVGAILLLALAILVYPSLRNRSKKPPK